MTRVEAADAGRLAALLSLVTWDRLLASGNRKATASSQAIVTGQRSRRSVLANRLAEAGRLVPRAMDIWRLLSGGFLAQRSRRPGAGAAPRRGVFAATGWKSGMSRSRDLTPEFPPRAGDLVPLRSYRQSCTPASSPRAGTPRASRRRHSSVTVVRGAIMKIVLRVANLAVRAGLLVIVAFITFRHPWPGAWHGAVVIAAVTAATVQLVLWAPADFNV